MDTRRLLQLPDATRAVLYGELQQIYQRLHDDLAALPQPCTACGHCCHFGQHGHRLYCSSLELAFVIEHHPPPRVDSAADVCPYLKNNRCTVREHRMLGCRSYFSGHTKQQRQQAEALHEQRLADLKALYRKHGLQWTYADCMAVFSDLAGASS